MPLILFNTSHLLAHIKMISSLENDYIFLYGK